MGRQEKGHTMQHGVNVCSTSFTCTAISLAVMTTLKNRCSDRTTIDTMIYPETQLDTRATQLRLSLSLSLSLDLKYIYIYGGRLVMGEMLEICWVRFWRIWSTNFTSWWTTSRVYVRDARADFQLCGRTYVVWMVMLTVGIVWVSFSLKLWDKTQIKPRRSSYYLRISLE